MCRYGISRVMNTSSATFPYATFTANVISCIILGMLIGLMLNKQLDSKMQLLLMTGFCGGFSTFSTFSAETYKLMEAGNVTMALVYIAASILVCLVCIGVGIKLGQMV